jgi:hypothetical protein
LEEGFKKWLENIRGKEGLEIKQKIFAYKTLDEAKETWSETEISIHEFSNMVLGSNSEIFSSISEQDFPPIFSKLKESSDSEKKPEIRGETVFRQSSANSDLPKGLYECEYCKAQGKPMFFATVEDLKGHIRAFHGGYPDKPDYVR